MHARVYRRPRFDFDGPEAPNYIKTLVFDDFLDFVFNLFFQYLLYFPDVLSLRLRTRIERPWWASPVRHRATTRHVAI